jgi:phosphoenolpyruvate carboxylase
MGMSQDWTVLDTPCLLHGARRQHRVCPTLRRARRRSWNEDERLKFLLAELTGRRPLLPPAMETSAEVKDVLDTFKVIGQLPPDSLGAYVISMAHTASDVLAVVLLQARRPAGQQHVHVMYA